MQGIDQVQYRIPDQPPDTGDGKLPWITQVEAKDPFWDIPWRYQAGAGQFLDGKI